MIDARDVGLEHTTFTYDTSNGYHRLLTMSQPGAKPGPNAVAPQGVLTNTYDLSNRVVMQTDPMSRTLKFEYTDLGSGLTQTNVTNTLGIATANSYDHLILTQSVSHANAPTSRQSVTTYNYEPGAPWLSSVTDPLNHTWSYKSDDFGNVISTTDPLARTTLYAYNTTNDFTTITYTNGLTTTYSYDAKGNLASIVRPVTETNQLITTTLGYDTDPLRPSDLLTVTNPLTKTWTYTYDTYGYPVTATNPLSQATGFTYDALGRLRTAVSPKGNTTTLAYNSYNDLTSVTDPLNYTTTYQYNPNGTLLWLTPPDSHTTSFYYNMDNEPISTTVPGGITNYYGYDSVGRIVSQSNGVSAPTRYSYDDINRITTVTDPLTHTTSYSYDLVGNLAIMTDALSSHLTTTYGYDNAYQLTGITYHDGGTTPNVSYAYNSLGLRTQMSDGSGTSLYSYDSLDRPLSVQDGAGHVITYTYDPGSRLTAITYPKLGGSGGVTMTRGYNDANRLTSVQDWHNNTTQFGYDADGDLTTINYPNGVTSTIGYNNADQVVTMTHAITSTPFLSFTYTRDKVGQLTTSDEGTTSGSLGAHGYAYDPYRLVGEAITSTSNISNAWTLDGATHIKKLTSRPTGSDPITDTYSYNTPWPYQLTRLVEQQGDPAVNTKWLNFSYDTKGNRLAQNPTGGLGHIVSYSYNQANELIKYQKDAGTLWTYGYNGDGLRTSKTNTATGSNEYFNWDVAAGMPLLLQDGSASYIYGPGGMPLEELVPGGPLGQETAYFYHADQLGSIRGVTDQTGLLANTYNYDAYGNTTSSSGTAYNRFGYTGEYTDGENGYLYLRARYYDPSTQQFLNVDPLVGRTGQAYNYVGGSPTNFTDPMGLRKLGSGVTSPNGDDFPVRVSDLRKIPRYILDEWRRRMGGYDSTEQLTYEIKEGIGGSKSDLYYNPKTGKVYVVPKKGGTPSETGYTLPDELNPSKGGVSPRIEGDECGGVGDEPRGKLEFPGNSDPPVRVPAEPGGPLPPIWGEDIPIPPEIPVDLPVEIPIPIW